MEAKLSVLLGHDNIQMPIKHVIGDRLIDVEIWINIRGEVWVRNGSQPNYFLHLSQFSASGVDVVITSEGSRSCVLFFFVGMGAFFILSIMNSKGFYAFGVF